MMAACGERVAMDERVRTKAGIIRSSLEKPGWGGEMVEGINDAGVTRWLADHVPALKSPVKYSLITGGHSNLTYRCEDSAGNAYVLRRPPLGHVLESAHDMGREHKIIAALAKTSVPVAPTYGQ